MNNSTFPTTTVTVLDAEGESRTTTLVELASGRGLVLDLWTTRCARCPRALDQLNATAIGWDQSDTPVLFVSACCDNGEPDDIEFAREIVEEGQWNSVVHTFLSHEEKERLKSTLGFNSVPHVAIVSPGGRVMYSGSEKGYGGQAQLREWLRPVTFDEDF